MVGSGEGERVRAFAIVGGRRYCVGPHADQPDAPHLITHLGPVGRPAARRVDRRPERAACLVDGINGVDCGDGKSSGSFISIRRADTRSCARRHWSRHVASASGPIGGSSSPEYMRASDCRTRRNRAGSSRYFANASTPRVRVPVSGWLLAAIAAAQLVAHELHVTAGHGLQREVAHRAVLYYSTGSRVRHTAFGLETRHDQ